MDDSKLDKLQFLLKAIEKKNLELEKYLSNFKSLARVNILKEITKDILKNNKLLKELCIEIETPSLDHQEIKEKAKKDLAEELILKIKHNPTKKVFILHEFLKQLLDISENDINVILKSLKEKNDKDLKSEISSLISIFKLKDSS